MRTRKALCVVLSTILLVGVSVGVADAQIFSPPKRISANRLSVFPKIALDGAGKVYVVWYDDSQVFFARSTDGDANFSVPLSLSPSRPALAPELVVDGNGAIIVVWWAYTQPDFSHSEVFFTRSTDAGLSFSTPVNVSNSSGQSSYPRVSVDSAGKIYILWTDVDPLVGGSLLISHSTDGGASFSAPRRLAEHCVVGETRDLAVDSNGAINIMFEGTLERPDQDVFFTRSVDGGTTFSPLKNISLSSAALVSFAPRQALDGSGNIHIAWLEGILPMEVLFASSTDGGVTFSINNLSGGSGSASLSSPELAVDGSGAINVVWIGTPPGASESDVFFSRSTDGGVTFTPPKNIPLAGRALEAQIVVTSSGEINLVWVEVGADLNVRVFFSRSTDGGATFSIPFNITLSVPFSRLPDLALDTRGDPHVVWMQLVFAQNEFGVYFSRSLDKLFQRLVDDVVALNLQAGLQNSLDAKLENALRALNDTKAGNNGAAINSLLAFVNAVEAQRGISLSDNDANALIATAQQIIALLGG